MCVDLLNRLADAVFRRRRLTGLLKVVVGLVVALSMGAAARAQRPFQVVTTADGGPGSLRQAITDANTGTGGSITFNIPTTDPGFDLPGSPNAWRIALGSPLPPIQRTTILNGLTQPGSACSSPRIEIRPATGASFTGDGIAILANDCAVRGLVINGFVDNGVSLTTATGCTVSCNFIGTDVTGTVLIGNGTGVLIANGVMNVIGGTEAGTANLVAGNVGIGVSVVTSGVPSNVGNSILRNSIRSNGALGIDLAANGVTDNDPLDLDVGPNHFQNYPVITGFVGGTISAVLDSLPNRRFRVEFFANSSQDPSNFGEGAQFIDALEVVSSAGGSANLSLPYTPGPGIRYVTATATSLPPLRSGDPGGESSDGFGLRGVAPAAPTGTSEFSRAFLVAAGANTPPVAQPVTVTTPEDTDVTVTLVATDVDGQLLAYRITGLPGAGQLLQFGSLTPIAATGTIVTDAQHRVVYRPPLNASGSPLTTFTYVANDGEADSNTTTVTVNVTPVNDPPAAADDVYATNEDTPLTVSTRALGVLGNDTDPEAPPQVLTAVLVTTTSHGSLTFNANGTFTYSPQPNFNGVDSFTYRASDGTVQSGVATATINVGPINDPPVARNDSYLTNEDVALTVSAPGVLLNDSDIDNDINAATVTIVAQPASGTLSNVAAGGFRYTPNLNFNGTDTFTYRLNDGAANSNIATVSIIVQPLNDPPVAADDAYSTNEDTGLVVATRAAGVLGNDTDPEGTTLSAVLVTTTSHGTLALAGDGSFNYAPAPNFNGADSFTYRASDGSAQSNTATVTIAVRPANDPPIATDDTYTTSEDTSLTVSTTAATRSRPCWSACRCTARSRSPPTARLCTRRPRTTTDRTRSPTGPTTAPPTPASPRFASRLQP
jgi:VCBS repeat-containing protein